MIKREVVKCLVIQPVTHFNKLMMAFDDLIHLSLYHRDSLLFNVPLLDSLIFWADTVFHFPLHCCGGAFNFSTAKKKFERARICWTKSNLLIFGYRLDTVGYGPLCIKREVWYTYNNWLRTQKLGSTWRVTQLTILGKPNWVLGQTHSTPLTPWTICLHWLGQIRASLSKTRQTLQAHGP